MGKKGFTLIELLVVISILAVLSTVGLATYSFAQMAAQDTRRKQDLYSLQQALEIYYRVNHTYPLVNDACPSVTVTQGNIQSIGWYKSTAALPNWIQGQTSCSISTPALDSNYISNMPIDPINDSASKYYYRYSSMNYSGCSIRAGQWYVLVAKLRNSTDPSAIGNSNTKWCDGTLLTSMGFNSQYWFLIHYR